MSWFDEQLKYRREKDDENLDEALRGVAGAVMGKRLTDALDAKEIAGSAIEEILKYFRCKSKSDELPPQIVTVEDQLEYRMRPHGIMRREMRLEKGWYRHAVGPMLGTMKEDGRAVALIPDRFSGYSYLDLASGKRVKVNRRTEKKLDEEVIGFYKPLPLRKLGAKDLTVFMMQQLGVADVALFIASLGAPALVGLLTPVFVKLLFGEVVASGSVGVLLSLAVFMVCHTFGSILLAANKMLVTARIGTKQSIAVRAAVMSRIMNLPAPFFKRFSAGELTQRAAYAESLCNLILDTVGSVGISSVFSLIYIGQIFVFAPSLVVPSLCITLLSLIVTVVAAVSRTRLNREYMQLTAKTGGLVYSTITGIQKIKLAGAEKRMFSRWAKHYAEEAALECNPPAVLKFSGTMNLAVSLIGTLILYAAAVKGNVSVADYYAFNASFGMVSGAFLALASVVTSLAQIRPSIEMLQPILETVPEVSEEKEVVTSLRGGIEISHVSFRYEENMPYVLDDLSLKIATGEYLAVVGTTGCGKSTLLRILLGFEKPQKGTVYYDRKDIARLDLKSLRRKIGVVMQDGRLTMGDIYSNIVISAPQLTLDDAWEAAELAAVAEDIRQMPMGMNTVIGEGQGGISGGQKQRLMIARALAPKPKILMFDEATSALDNVTQKKVSEAIDALGCTRIVIAHRLSTIRHADRIICLDGGKIAESGTYEELIEKNGVFASLISRQRSDTSDDGQ